MCKSCEISNDEAVHAAIEAFTLAIKLEAVIGYQRFCEDVVYNETEHKEAQSHVKITRAELYTAIEQLKKK